MRNSKGEEIGIELKGSEEKNMLRGCKYNPKHCMTLLMNSGKNK